MPYSRSETPDLRLRYFRPPAGLDRYFQTIFLLEVFPPEGGTITDFVLPSWGIVSWRDRSSMTLQFRDGEMFNSGLSGAVGPFDHAVRLESGALRQWSAVLLPAGWSRFVDAPARLYGNRAVDIENDPAFSAFWPVGERLFKGPPDAEAEATPPEWKEVVERLGAIDVNSLTPIEALNALAALKETLGDAAD